MNYTFSSPALKELSKFKEIIVGCYVKELDDNVVYKIQGTRINLMDSDLHE